MLKIFALFYILSFGFTAHLPEGFPRCKYINSLEEQQEFKECYIDASEKAKKFLIEGISTLGLPSIQNIVIPSITIQQKTRTLAFNATLTNVTCIGLENYKVTNVSLDPTRNFYLNAEFYIPKIDLDGTFNVRARILDQIIERDGHFTAALEEVDANGIIIGERYKKNGVEYLKIEKFTVDPKIKKARGDFGDLLGENAVLNRILNEFLEQSTSYLLEALKPDIQKLVDTLVKTLGQTIVDKVPYNEIFYV